MPLPRRGWRRRRIDGGQPLCWWHGHGGGPRSPQPFLHHLLPGPPHPDPGGERPAAAPLRWAEPRQQAVRGGDPPPAGQAARAGAAKRQQQQQPPALPVPLPAAQEPVPLHQLHHQEPRVVLALAGAWPERGRGRDRRAGGGEHPAAGPRAAAGGAAQHVQPGEGLPHLHAAVPAGGAAAIGASLSEQHSCLLMLQWFGEEGGRRRRGGGCGVWTRWCKQEFHCQSNTSAYWCCWGEKLEHGVSAAVGLSLSE